RQLPSSKASFKRRLHHANAGWPVSKPYNVSMAGASSLITCQSSLVTWECCRLFLSLRDRSGHSTNDLPTVRSSNPCVGDSIRLAFALALVVHPTIGDPIVSHDHVSRRLAGGGVQVV